MKALHAAEGFISPRALCSRRLGSTEGFSDAEGSTVPKAPVFRRFVPLASYDKKGYPFGKFLVYMTYIQIVHKSPSCLCTQAIRIKRSRNSCQIVRVHRQCTHFVYNLCIPKISWSLSF
ncbi:unnamed protein product [Cuscuta epithymum]|uniref:Uncharacterized protein n=1 Tax=Cuscuta epithymum TaxID=186058 RepID=A0AAV0EJD8_9ASTE|nr:unnamed protein product [Cuscuta epithymum]